MCGDASRGLVVKASRVLDVEVGQAADLPYEETRLAKRAPGARKRLTGILLVGAVALAIEAYATSFAWLGPCAFVLLVAFRLQGPRLGAIMGAGLVATLAALLPLALLFFIEHSPSTLVALGVSFVLGVAALPDVILLMRDAELQNAYGLWAKRER